jgi:hypothetical protein
MTGIKSGLQIMTAVGSGYSTKELARQLKYIYSERLNAWKIEVRGKSTNQ